MFGQGGFLDHKDTVANITLCAKEVLPRLRELNPEPQKRPRRRVNATSRYSPSRYRRMQRGRPN